MTLYSLDFPYAYGGPICSGQLRAQPEDFYVDEILGFEPAGEGEHIFIHVEKVLQNTEWIAKQMTRFANVRSMDVSYSGQKDRRAVTRQWFSIYYPKGDPLDWSQFSVDGVTLLQVTRHQKKLRRGSHKANRFRIRLTQLNGEVETLPQKLEALEKNGVPNYFGEQRFGKELGNLTNAEHYFAGQRKAKNKFQRGMLLSAARSYLFNQVLAARVTNGTWNQILQGDVFTLDRNGADFYLKDDATQEALSDVAQRNVAGDVHITGPLWGEGSYTPWGEAAELEQTVLADFQLFKQGLEKARLKHERRSLRLPIKNLQWNFEECDKLVCDFQLPKGGYATSVIREILRSEINEELNE